MTGMNIDADFNFDNSYAEQLEGFYVPFMGDKAPKPKLIRLNHALAETLGLDIEDLSVGDIAAIFSGGVSLKGGRPLAQVYAGHQFGGFSPQLGDGRALLLGEVIDRNGDRRDIHLKGSGRTPYSRGGDGKAVIGPVLREYILGEAMFALNVPTTRALAAVTTGEQIFRDGMFPGAVLARVASSHIRVGTFEFFAAQGETAKVKQLADYSIRRHFSELTNSKDCYLKLLRAVCERQAALLAKWMCVGFVHGVMNTDNMAIAGETIDYGPCAFIDTYDASAVFSSIDHQGRYAYGNQAQIAQWNLTRLAETLLPLINEDTDEAVRLATDELKAFSDRYQTLWVEGMRAKLGLASTEEEDLNLIIDLHNTMQGQNVDFTLFFRGLSSAAQGETNAVRSLFDDPENFDQWYALWSERLSRDAMNQNERETFMNAVNPIYIPRNHKVEEALQAAEKDSNYSLFEKLMDVLENPFVQRDGMEEYAVPAPKEFGLYKTFCGT